MQDLHLVAELSDGRRWHAVRRPDGSWTRLGDLGVAAGTPRFPLAAGGACAGIGAELHVLVDQLGPLMHTIRFADGTWQRFGNVNAASDDDDPLWDPACAGIGEELHLVAASKGNRVVHTIRYADGSWQDVGNVSHQAGQQGDLGPQPITAACELAGELHVFVIADNSILHTVRHANGRWDAWENLSRVIHNAPEYTSALAAAGVGGELQLAIIPGQVFAPPLHALRGRNGAWTPFANVYNETGDRGGSFKVAAAAVDGELHLAVVTGHQPYLWHAIRHANGTWTRLGSVPAATGRPGTDAFVGAELAGVDDTAVSIPPGPQQPCYSGTLGASTVRVQNETGDDTLSVWRFDTSAGVPALIGTSNSGDITAVELPNCHFSQIIAVSHNWVDEYNATFGTAFNADDWPTAQTVNFQRWATTVLGRNQDPTVAFAVT